MDGGEETIFVCIPSYRDPECQHTIANLFHQAAIPSRVFVGVCWQTHPTDDAHCFEVEPPLPSHVRTIMLDWTEARGPCLARHHAQSLYQGEEYLLMIDSHTRFAARWDAMLLEMLKSCDSPKPIITGYPAGYSRPNVLSEDKYPPFLCVKGFGEDGMLRLHGRSLSQGFHRPLRSLFWVSGFSFSKAAILSEVPYDPHVPFLFFGEETSMAARLWTHGWDFFAPSQHIVYHLWSRDYRPTFRELEDKASLERRSQRRIWYMLGMLDLDLPENRPDALALEGCLVEFEKYGLGVTMGRDLEAFQQFSGVCFLTRTVTEEAKRGGLPESMFMDSIIARISALMSLGGS